MTFWGFGFCYYLKDPVPDSCFYEPTLVAVVFFWTVHDLLASIFFAASTVCLREVIALIQILGCHYDMDHL